MSYASTKMGYVLQEDSDKLYDVLLPDETPPLTLYGIATTYTDDHYSEGMAVKVGFPATGDPEIASQGFSGQNCKASLFFKSPYYRYNKTRAAFLSDVPAKDLAKGTGALVQVFGIGEEPSFCYQNSSLGYLTTNKSVYLLPKRGEEEKLTKIRDCPNIFAARSSGVSTFEDDDSTLILGMNNGIRYRLENRDLLGETDKRIRCSKDNYLSDTVTSEDIVASDIVNEDYPAGLVVLCNTNPSHAENETVGDCTLTGTVKFSTNTVSDGIKYRPLATLPDTSKSTVGIKYFDIKQGQWHIIPVFEYWYEYGEFSLASVTDYYHCDGYHDGELLFRLHEYTHDGNVKFCWNSGDHFLNFTKETFSGGKVQIPYTGGDYDPDLGGEGHFYTHASVIFSNGAIEVKFLENDPSGYAHVCQDGEFKIMNFSRIWHSADPNWDFSDVGEALVGTYDLYRINVPHPSAVGTLVTTGLIKEPVEGFYHKVNIGTQAKMQVTAHYWDGTTSVTADTDCKINNYSDNQYYGLDYDVDYIGQTIFLDGADGWDCFMSWTFGSGTNNRNWHSYNGGAVENVIYTPEDEGIFACNYLMNNSPFGSTRQTVFFKDKDEINVVNPYISEKKYEWTGAEQLSPEACSGPWNYNLLYWTESVSNDTYMCVIDKSMGLLGNNPGKIQYTLLDNRHDIQMVGMIDMPPSLAVENYVWDRGRLGSMVMGEYEESLVWSLDLHNYHVITENNILYCILSNIDPRNPGGVG